MSIVLVLIGLLVVDVSGAILQKRDKGEVVIKINVSDEVKSR